LIKYFLCVDIVRTFASQMQTVRKGRMNPRQQFPSKRAAFRFAFFFAFLFVFGKASALPNNPQTAEDGHENSHALGNLAFDCGQCAHFPFNSGPCPWEPDPTDKVETNDSFDDEETKSFYRSWEKQRFDFDVVAAKRLLRQLSVSSKNRETVSLFILYHSWKSFPHLIPTFC
jgi:hypothetical protein